MQKERTVLFLFSPLSSIIDAVLLITQHSTPAHPLFLTVTGLYFGQ